MIEITAKIPIYNDQEYPHTSILLTANTDPMDGVGIINIAVGGCSYEVNADAMIKAIVRISGRLK